MSARRPTVRADVPAAARRPRPCRQCLKHLKPAARKRIGNDGGGAMFGKAQFGVGVNIPAQRHQRRHQAAISVMDRALNSGAEQVLDREVMLDERRFDHDIGNISRCRNRFPASLR
jgi:hypothetical protein